MHRRSSSFGDSTDRPGSTRTEAADARHRAPDGRKRQTRQTADPLRILMIGSEAHPFAATGGLSEVLGALPRALARMGHSVTIVLPRYGAAARRTVATSPGEPDGASFQLGSRGQRVGYLRHRLTERVDAVFVEAPELFDRDALYGTADADYADNAHRFAVLSRAALEYVRLRDDRPSVVHAHDWQAGLVPAYLKVLYRDDPVLGGVPAVFTIHNLAFQGLYPAHTLPEIGLPWDVMHPEGLEFWGQISYLKAGINFSERITTVSPAYAGEILSPELGFGFEGVLARRRGVLHGILNGIDTERWNPQTDPHLPAPFGPDDLDGKREAKRMLLQSTGLPVSADAMHRPLIALVSRLTDQKGWDLLSASEEALMGLEASWVLMGNGERRYEERWSALAARFPDRVSATIGYDERLEHLIHGGADLCLMPSRFEPCGLNQLNSLKYGTIPVVRATGGLDDTVVDASQGNGRGTGFKFSAYTPEALLDAVRRAVAAYHQRERWAQLQRTAMLQDYSWDASAREYVKVYSGDPEGHQDGF